MGFVGSVGTLSSLIRGEVALILAVPMLLGMVLAAGVGAYIGAWGAG